mgnify:CR=1 FL=1
MARKLADPADLARARRAPRAPRRLARRCTRSKERSPPTSRRPWRARAASNGGAERADGGNGGDAKRDAQHEDGEAAGAGAELAQGDSERKRQALTACRRGCDEVGGGHDARGLALGARRSSPGRRRGSRCGRSAWRASGHG